jgi:hypothetical protein
MILVACENGTCCVLYSLYIHTRSIPRSISTSYKESKVRMEGAWDANRYEPFCSYPSDWVLLTKDILTSDWRLSKPLLSLARYGRYPINANSAFSKKVMVAIHAIARHAFGSGMTVDSLSFQELGRKLQSKYPDKDDPIIRGIVIQMCELVRMPREEEDKARLDALWKEVSVFRRVVVGRPEIYWDAMWQGGRMVKEVEMTPWSETDIGYALSSALNRISRTILYPSMSRKLLPERTRMWLQNRPNQVFEDPDLATPAELEKLYIVHGVHFHGPAEIKQRWYMHGLAPRTYATAGETAFTYSKYLKEVWNILWNAFPPTEKFNRVDISRIRRKSAKYSFAMYDLQTFTSNLETHRDFVLSLSRYCNIDVEVMDGRRGICKMSLSHLLEEYANYLCQGVTWYTKLGGLDYIEEEVHAVAGLLGIIGNIASCGLAHGIFLRTLVESLDEEGVAGDDAIFVYLIEQGWQPKTDMVGKYLGTLAEDKVFDEEEEDAVYLKRGVRKQDEFTLTLSDYVFFPKLLFHSKNDTERFRESRDVEFERYLFERMFVSSLGSTFRSAGKIPHDYSVLKDFLVKQYYHLELPILGHCPGIGRTHFVPVWAEDLFIPAIDRLGDSEYVRNQYLDKFDGWGRFPETELPFESVPFDLQAGLVFQAKMSKQTSYLCRLGVLEKEKVMVEIAGSLAYERMERIIEKKSVRPVYEFRVKDAVLMEFCHRDVTTVFGCPMGQVCESGYPWVLSC